jgi:hypothetical protein
MQFTRDKHSHRTIASTNASRTMQPHKPKLALELAIRHADKNFNFFSPSLLEKIKTPDPQTDTTKTVELNKDNGLQTRTTERQLVTAAWRNGGFSASYDSFVVNQTVALRISICAEKPAHRQSAKRYWLVYFVTFFKSNFVS